MTKNIQIGIALGMTTILIIAIFLAQKAVASFIDISASSLNDAGIETERSFYMTPAKITGLAGGYDKGVINLYWKPIKKSKLNGYRIYRGDGKGMEVIIGSSISSGYTDHEIKRGEIYRYRVSAVNDLGEGALSNAVEVSAK